MGYKNIKFENNSVFLVTGGAGFIGSNLCERILELGYKVRCLDNLSTGKQENVDLFLDNPDYQFIYGDITDPEVCMEACRGIDYVLHQAAWGSVPRSIEMPLFYEETNIKGTLNMFEAARRNQVKKMVYASSSSVYGDSDCMPKKEGVEGNLLSPYAVTKRTCEEFAKQYTMYYGLDTYGMRYFNVFGQRQNPDGAYAAVIPKFIGLLMAGKRPTIYGDGTQSRDFTFVENVVEANLKACLASHEAAGHAYNIAFGQQVRLIDIYHTLAETLGVSLEPEFTESRIGDIKYSIADINKAKNLLGYDPDYSLDKGLKLTIEWYQQNR